MSKLSELSLAGFRPDKKLEKLNDEFMRRLGFQTHYGPARLAIAMSLSNPDKVNIDAAGDHEKGREIRGTQLLGKLSPGTMTSLVVQHAGRNLSKHEIQLAVSAHWSRGLKKLDKIWREVDEDFDRFIDALGGNDDSPVDMREESKAAVSNATMESKRSVGEISIIVGKSMAGKEISWVVNAPGGSPHVAVMGETNTGKTHFALNVAEEIKRQSDCAVLVLDMGKGDIAVREQKEGKLGAAVLSSPRNPVPLDILHVADHSDNAAIQTAASRFFDSLSHVSSGKLGDVQRSVLQDILSPMLEAQTRVSIEDILRVAREHYQGQGKKDDSIIAALKQANNYKLFAPEESPSKFFGTSQILDMHKAEESIQRFSVFMVLTAYSRYLMNLPDSPTDAEGNRKITSLLVIDEARKVLGKKHPALVDIVRMGRSKGCVVILISQSPADYQEEADFLTDIGVNVCFRTNATQRDVERVFKKRLPTDNLAPGECFFRSSNIDTQKVKVWD